eukprot:CAMPEP_0195512008 /NCGR_PEP_ID=MMETSP0794_2-20130614/4127_1 /TAXON_ID=515487 /ORGANISM="Stephanopyxis turris, Strain CCMP 815" /LENGTH=735 /DNA_ID=CAMNT_0040639721 /DNA_START=211 /DNA_END=2418 /DNA_ORIENTATION=+
MATEDETTRAVPYHLMPLCAVFGMYAFLASIRAVYQIQASYRFDPKTATTAERVSPPTPVASKRFLYLILSIFGSIVSYGYMVAQVNNAIADNFVFDPYEILELDVGSDAEDARKRYRLLSKTHHPDKGGDDETFHRINLAYRALSDEVSRENWEKYGHPDGRQHETISLAMPDWLLNPSGGTAVVLVLLYMGMFVGLIVYVIQYGKRLEAKQKLDSDSLEANVNGKEDVKYLQEHLKDDSSHYEILYYIASTPENMKFAEGSLDKNLEAIRKKKEAMEEQRKNKGDDFGLDDGGWAEDDDEEDEATKAKAALLKKEEDDRKMAARQLAAATGKPIPEDPLSVKIESMDEGVLGQKWVEESLTKGGMWPPKGDLAKMIQTNSTYLIDKYAKPPKIVTLNDSSRVQLIRKNDVSELKKMYAAATAPSNIKDPLDIPSVRRNMLTLTGRLHSTYLNTQPILLEAGAKGLIDKNYFTQTMQFRQRNTMLLDACLRMALHTKRFNLAKTIVETLTMFKVGTDSATHQTNKDWFKDIMHKQYGPDGFPTIKVVEKRVETEGQNEIATGDTCALFLHMERTHAQRFTEAKLAQCKKQGQDPRMAMQLYQECWWTMMRANKIGDNEETFLAAWPFLVRSIAQKEGKIKVQFKAPEKPGKYKLLIDIKSQDFIGADQTLEVDFEVLPLEDVERKEKKEEEGQEEEEENDEDDDDDDDDDEDHDEEDDDDEDHDEEDEESKKEK